MCAPVPPRKVFYVVLCALAIGALGCSPEDRDKDLAGYHAERVAGIDRLNEQEGMPDAWQTHYARAAAADGETPIPQEPVR